LDDTAVRWQSLENYWSDFNGTSVDQLMELWPQHSNITLVRATRWLQHQGTAVSAKQLAVVVFICMKLLQGVENAVAARKQAV
jgi:hypothetical protein